MIFTNDAAEAPRGARAGGNKRDLEIVRTGRYEKVDQRLNLNTDLVCSVMLKLDGQPQGVVLSALRRIYGVGRRHNGWGGALVRDSVIRVGNDAHLMLVQGAAYDVQMRKTKSRIEVEICYCSILERCWISALDGTPQEVGRCEDKDSLETPELQADTAVAPIAKQ